MSTLKVDTILKRSGSSVSIGETGDTINLAGAAYAAAGDNTPSFGATASSTQSIGNGSFVKVTLNTESWDTDSAFDNSTNYRFTVPSGEGGKYVFHYGGYLVSMTTNGYFQLQLYKNGSQLRSSGFRTYMSASTTSSDYTHIFSYNQCKSHY